MKSVFKMWMWTAPISFHIQTSPYQDYRTDYIVEGEDPNGSAKMCRLIVGPSLSAYAWRDNFTTAPILLSTTTAVQAYSLQDV